MSNSISFNSFEMTPSLLLDSITRYSQVIANTILSKDCPQVQTVVQNYKDKSGIYFWVMQIENKAYSIYLGRTQSLSKRVQNYINEFQPHSPNDYKLRVFWDYIRRQRSQAQLKLLFFECSKDNLKDTEKIEIKHFSPLLNKTQKRIPEEARTVLKTAFAYYYISMFESFLK